MENNNMAIVAGPNCLPSAMKNRLWFAARLYKCEHAFHFFSDSNCRQRHACRRIPSKGGNHHTAIVQTAILVNG